MLLSKKGLRILALLVIGGLAITYLPRWIVVHAGTPFYVDNSCPNNGDGLGMTCAGSPGGTGPFNSIANVQSVVTGSQPGNSVLLKRGKRFNEQFDVGASGTVAGQFTIDAYDVGATPIISGSTSASTTGAWSAATATTGSVSQANMRLSIVNGTAFVDFSGANLLTPYVGGRITITDGTGTHSLVGYIKAAGSGETLSATEEIANTDFANTTGIATGNATVASIAGGQSGNCLEVTLTGGFGSARQNLSASTSGMLLKNSIYMKLGTGTDNEAFNFDDSSFSAINSSGYVNPSVWTQYVVYGTMTANTPGIQFYQGITSGKTYLFDTASSKQVLGPSSTGVTIVSTPGGSTYNWASETTGFNRNDTTYTYSIVPVNVWQTAAIITATPQGVFRDNVRLASVGGIYSLTTTSQYYYDSAAHIIYTYATANPAASGDTFEIPQRNYSVQLYAASYVTVQNLEMDYANYVCLQTQANANAFLISANSFNYCGFSNFDAGVQVKQTSGGRITGNTIVGSFSGIVVSGYGGLTTNAVQVDHNAVSYSAYQGITLTTGPTNSTIEYNYVHHCNQTVDDTAGIYTVASGTGNVIRYNQSLNNGTASTRGAAYMIDLTSAPAILYGNIGAYSNNGCIDLENAGHIVYQNTCYHDNENSYDVGEINFFGNAGTATVENNIFVASTAKHVLLANSGAVTGHTINFNDYSGGSATPFGWNSSDYNFANYKTASSQDANSLNIGPTFANAAGGQFWQTVGSSGIASGTPLGAPYNIGMYPGSSWPYNVFLTPNVNNDLGAFSYTGSVIDSVSNPTLQSSGTTQ